RRSAAVPASTGFGHPRLCGLAGVRQAATPALGFIPDLFDKPLVSLDAKLNHHIHEQIEEALNIRVGKLAPTRTLLDKEHELLEGELAAPGVDGRDRARVA